jgi:hypothetical protein
MMVEVEFEMPQLGTVKLQIILYICKLTLFPQNNLRVPPKKKKNPSSLAALKWSLKASVNCRQLALICKYRLRYKKKLFPISLYLQGKKT